MAGSAYHGVGDDGFRFREIAEIMGGRLRLPVASKISREAQRRLGWIAPFTIVDNPVTSAWTQQALGWRPRGPSLAEGLEGGRTSGRPD